MGETISAEARPIRLKGLAFGFCVLSLLAAACSKGVSTAGKGSHTSDSAKGKLADQSELTEVDRHGSDAPLSVEVAQAFFEKENLNVRVRLQAKTDIDPAHVAVSLIGLHEGKVVEEKSQRLSDAFSGERLHPGQSALLLFELSGRGLTEYQIKCSWGADAEGAIGRTEKAEKSEKEKLSGTQPASQKSEVLPDAVSNHGFLLESVITEKVEIDCVKPPCDNLFTLYGTLVNRSESSVGDIKLALGLFWVNDGHEPKFPMAKAPKLASEELISLQAVAIPPGESKKVRVKVDKQVPVVDGGAFVPNLRILSYTSGT